MIGRIEYNEYPPPQLLLKAMERQWAEKLIDSGSLRLRKLEYYRQWENDHLGDANDGRGLFHMAGDPVQTDSGNDVYAWCLSLPDISNAQLLEIAKHGEYNCVVRIHSPEELFKRMLKFLQEHKKGFRLHNGYVHYNRGAEIDKETLKSQKFHFNVFQKEQRFQENKEYRISITNCTLTRYKEDYLDLLLGDSSDILSIEPLSNSPLQWTLLTSHA